MVRTNNQSQLLMRSSRYDAGWQPILAAPETEIGRYPSNAPAAKRRRWKGKKPGDKRRTEAACPRRFHNKKKPVRGGGGGGGRFAPRNTTSFLMRAKRAGGVAPPGLLVDAAAEQLGVDGYGTMKGLIRLRLKPRVPEDSDGSGEVEVERRLGQGVGRFEMVRLPDGQTSALGHRADDQELHILRLEEENLTLRDRVLAMEGEMAEARRRLQSLEEEEKGGGEVLDD